MKYKEWSSRRLALSLLAIVLFLGVIALIVGGAIEMPIPLLGTFKVDSHNKGDSNVLPVNKLPPDLQGSPDVVISKIWALLKERNILLEEKNRLETDIQNSFRSVDRELITNGTINTNRTVIDERGRELNKHVQRCLMAIGCYNGNINGEPDLTSSSVKQFQACKSIKVDGVIGQNTWHKIHEEFEFKRLQ